MKTEDKIQQAQAAIKKLMTLKGCARRTRRLLRWDRQLWNRYRIASGWRSKPWTVKVANPSRHLIIENFPSSAPKSADNEKWMPNLQPYQVKIFMSEGTLNLQSR